MLREKPHLLLPTLWMAASILMVFAGLGTLFQAKSRATAQPTAENTRLIKAKNGKADSYVNADQFGVGLGLVAFGMASTMLSCWIWGTRRDARCAQDR